MILCPFCHLNNEADTLFCEQCKANLSDVPGFFAPVPVEVLPVVAATIKAMDSRERTLQVYQELSDSFEGAQNPGLRDMFLMLAADAALRAGHAAEAELLCVRLLRLNPDHLLKPYASFAEAVTAPDIQNYLDGLRQRFPVETAEDMLESMLFQTALDAPWPATVEDDSLKVYRLHPESPRYGGMSSRAWIR